MVGDVDIIRLLVEKHGVPIDARLTVRLSSSDLKLGFSLMIHVTSCLQDGSWPLHFAMFPKPRVEVVRLFVEGYGAVHQAATCGDIDVLVMLIEQLHVDPQDDYVRYIQMKIQKAS